jgi:predicted unusual protein kinase regulating ubiquinone biosynthesis (AarF/ABC1/UbiB family)
MADNKKISQLKTSVLSRSLSFAKLGLNAGLKFAATKVMNNSMDDFLNSQSVKLASELGQLKGSAMKAGQLLSIYGEHFLPEEANRVLKTLQNDSPQVEWNVMKKHIDNYLKPEKLDLIEINPEPIGSASMGQVYSAVIKKTGERIALKVQYPGVEKAIDSDVAALKKILSISKIIPSEIKTDGLFDEIKSMLRQELNYETEALLTKKYRELVQNDDRFIVPKVFDEFSNHYVLATEYVEGLKPDHEIIKNLSQNRKNRISENFLDLYLKEIFQWRTVQTDPHLGNYKIKLSSDSKDKIILLDFGAVKIFPDAFIDSYKKLIAGSVLNDDQIFVEGSKQLGFITESDDPEYIHVFKKFCNDTVEPFWDYTDIRNDQKKISHDGTYDWKKTDLPTRIVKSAFQFKNYKLRTPPQELIFLDRKTAGVFMFLNSMGAIINARQIILPYLASYAEGSIVN